MKQCWLLFAFVSFFVSSQVHSVTKKDSYFWSFLRAIGSVKRVDIGALVTNVGNGWARVNTPFACSGHLPPNMPPIVCQASINNSSSSSNSFDDLDKAERGESKNSLNLILKESDSSELSESLDKAEKGESPRFKVPSCAQATEKKVDCGMTVKKREQGVHPLFNNIDTTDFRNSISDQSGNISDDSGEVA